MNLDDREIDQLRFTIVDFSYNNLIANQNNFVLLVLRDDNSPIIKSILTD